MSWGDDLDLTDLVPCPECPRPGLVPSKEMTEHIALLHQGEAFRCAVCKVSLLRGIVSIFKSIRSFGIQDLTK